MDKSLSKLHDKPLAPHTSREKGLVEELRTTFRKLPALDTSNCFGSEKMWASNVNHLRELVLNKDPREFLRWHVISSTMFAKFAPYIIPELKYLKGCRDWKTRWCKAIKEFPIGHPIPYWRYPESSGNLIHHAYHLAQFEEKTVMRVDDMDFIFEFGGGYGSMCRLFHNCGFEGKYVLFDLPAFSALQHFFLSSINTEVHSIDSFKAAKSGVVCISDLEQIREILLNHFEAGKSMFVATWSISEAPIDLRNSILPLTSLFKAFLIAYQDHFQEVNNLEFFRDWKAAQQNIEWYEWSIEHMPGNRYLVGGKRGN